MPGPLVSAQPGLRVILVQLKACSFPAKSIPFLENAYGSLPGEISADELVVTLFRPPVEKFLAELKPLYRLSHKVFYFSSVFAG